MGADELIDKIRLSVIGADVAVDGPFGLRRVTYADYTASGRSLSFIEDYIRRAVLPLYANTHTETSGTGFQTTKFREEAREIIRGAVGGSQEHAVIFAGSDRWCSSVHTSITPTSFPGESRLPTWWRSERTPMATWTSLISRKSWREAPSTRFGSAAFRRPPTSPASSRTPRPSPPCSTAMGRWRSSTSRRPPPTSRSTCRPPPTATWATKTRSSSHHTSSSVGPALPECWWCDAGFSAIEFRPYRAAVPSDTSASPSISI